MTDLTPETVAAPLAAAPERTRRSFPLCDLAVAPENLRATEPPDADIPQLAETVFAAGVLHPLTVRPGRGKAEKPAMALDGRRRLLALWSLAEQGRIAWDYPVETFVETDPARQAAAIVLTNTAVPVHIADVIVAIGKMLKGKLTPAVIAGALGYGEIEVRRLAALAGLHPKALEALKLGKLTLRQAKLLARLADRKQQGEIAASAIGGFGFQEWRVTEQLEAGAVTTHDRRFPLVGAARYAAAGGRTEADLFGERASVLLDPEVLQALWTERAETLAAGLAGEGRTVRVLADPEAPPTDDLEPFGYGYGMGLGAEALATWRAAEETAQAARAALDGADLASDEADGGIAAYLAAALAAEQASEPSRIVTLVLVSPSAHGGLALGAYGPPAPALEVSTAEEADEEPAAPFAFAAPVSGVPLALAPRPDLKGVNHALHAVRTDVATRALVRALADDPAAALTALLARLFSVIVLSRGLGRGGAALTVQAEPYGSAQTPPIEALDGDVRRRLADRRAAWDASGVSVIAWVAGLADGEKMALLAELTALSLDLREARTSQLRWQARAEAVEIATLCGADVTRHWTPDAPFLAAHPKPKLLAMLAEMGAEDARAAQRRKDELVSLVAERAAERAWAPAYLSWAGEAPRAEPGEADAEAAQAA